MENTAKLSLSLSEHKKPTRQLSLIMVLTFMIGLSFAGCKKEKEIERDCEIENENNSENTTTDEYYVKYEVDSKTIYLGGKLDLEIKTEDNKLMTTTIDQRVLHETIIGPVDEGFSAFLNVRAAGETYDKLKLYTKIYVSKNDSPFALKKSDGSDDPRDFVKLLYTIDY